MSYPISVPKPMNRISQKIMRRPETVTFLAFVALCLFMSFFSNRFLTVSNLTNVARQISINGVMAVGMTFVILTGGIDLSVGSVMALTGTIMAGAMVNQGWPSFVAVLAGLALGIVLGLINGSLVAYAKLPAIIVTLAMMEAARGLALLYTGGYPLAGLPSSFSTLGRGFLFDIQLIPIPAVVMLITYLAAYILLNHIPFGRYFFAVGDNEEAAHLSGVNTRKVKILAHVISGFTAALAGLIITSRLMSGQPNAGEGFELDAIAAVVLGGTDIAGGRGSILGTLIGSLTMGVLSNGLNLMGVSPYVQRVIKGLIIVGAIFISSRRRNR